MGEATEANKLILSGCLILNPPLISFVVVDVKEQMQCLFGPSSLDSNLRLLGWLL